LHFVEFKSTRAIWFVSRSTTKKREVDCWANHFTIMWQKKSFYKVYVVKIKNFFKIIQPFSAKRIKTKLNQNQDWFYEIIWISYRQNFRILEISKTWETEARIACPKKTKNFRECDKKLLPDIFLLNFFQFIDLSTLKQQFCLYCAKH
jgi:hypothetical protein